ncbi:uncharacterized protein [Malus domestica]|uniref:uncharacterized protein n=1 Tax=Malus domestica TaxID=3750 RepID=UPI0039766019
MGYAGVLSNPSISLVLAVIAALEVTNIPSAQLFTCGLRDSGKISVLFCSSPRTEEMLFILERMIMTLLVYHYQCRGWVEGSDDGSWTKKTVPIIAPLPKTLKALTVTSEIELRRGWMQNIHDAIWKERTHQVDQYVVRWVYEAGISFHAIDNDSFKRVMEAVGQFGSGYLPPSQYELREPLLKEEVERVKKSLKKHEEEWALNGCSIMTDAWSDQKRRSIMNLCVNCKEGTIFLSSKECSSEAHTGEYIFEYVDKCVEEIGPPNVIQVVTDNASNNMAAANMMRKKRPNMFWTSCATHTLNLMLQGIGNLPRFKGVIDKAKAFTIFIYAHHKTLALMRKHTKKRDIIRPGVTRFATSFLTLQSLMDKKKDLKVMVASEEWEQCKHVKTTKGKVAYATVLSSHF